ncbi:Peptide deformylase 1 [Gammaproteobacteria bacterium]
MGHPLLVNIAEPVTTFDTPQLHDLVQDLRDTMEAHQGVGLAAPQIGVGLRVVVFGLRSHSNYPHIEEIPFTTLVNPILDFMDGEIDQAWEGCLSVPGMRGVVPRYTCLRYRAFDVHGVPLSKDEVTGFHARVIQHECDHLDGILYPYRIHDLRHFGFTDELFPSHAGERTSGTPRLKAGA